MQKRVLIRRLICFTKKRFFPVLFFCFWFESQVAAGDKKIDKPEPSPQTINQLTQETAEDKKFEKARTSLKKVFQGYQYSSLIIPVKQEVFLSIIKTGLVSKGSIFLQNEKFRLDLKGKPSSRALFDGLFLWHQPDLAEKVVFKLKKPAEIQMLNHFFLKDKFFDNFKIVDFKSNNRFLFYHLKPKKEIRDLKEVFMKTDAKIVLELRFVWKNSNSWQKYSFLKPVIKKNPEALFKWNPTGFRILEKASLSSSP